MSETPMPMTREELREFLAREVFIATCRKLDMTEEDGIVVSGADHEQFTEYVDAWLSALDKAGLAIVPKEPTPEQLALTATSQFDYSHEYREMVAASPYSVKR
jgi:hypothetical protein